MTKPTLIATLLLCLCARGVSAPFPSPPNLAELRSSYGLSDSGLQRLREQGFIVLGDRTIRSLHEAYPEDPRDPFILVTTDALLQLWHDLYLEALKAAELQGLHPGLRGAVAGLRRSCSAASGKARAPSARSALRDALTLLTVADCLLSGANAPPGPVQRDAAALLARVRAHSERHAYPGDDYTQYNVRGHYASSEALGRYFLGSMWLSRRILSVQPERALPDPDAPLRCAVALAFVLRSDRQARELLRKVNVARQSLAGVPNAISVEQCASALDQALGKGWTLEAALAPQAMARLRAELGRPGYPAARVRTGSARPGVFPNRVIALVPDHSVPDSVLFRMTMFDEVPGRSIASGLDVAAALGHQAAEEEIRRTDPQARAVLAAVERQRSAMRDDGRSIYRGWLGALGTLARTPSGAPEFMRGEAWGYQKVNTTLAGWAQLRHASVLYAAHAYATAGMADEMPRGWVEPYPAFYRAMADLADRTARVMRNASGLSKDHEALLARFSAKCSDFAVYADAELAGTLTRRQGDAIRGFGSWLNRFPFRSKPVIADVATGSGGEVLHAAVGDMNPIIAIPDRANAVAYVGWVSSYYEIARPTTERLTDAQWQTLLDSPHTAPQRPPWSARFVHLERGARWEAMAPLREAEALFAAGKPGPAIAILRRTIEQDPWSEAAVEARYRIGEQYRRERKLREAEKEWAACLQMRGGEAWDRAREGLARVRWEINADDRWRTAFLREVARLKALLRELHGPVTGAARLRLEKQAATLALSDHLRCPAAPHAPTMEDVTRACRSAAVREALEWRRLDAVGEDLGYRLDDIGRSEYVSDCLRFLRTASSPVLRASILIRAIGFGYMADRPIEAAHALARCKAPHVERSDRSRALEIIKEYMRTKGQDTFWLEGLGHSADSAADGLAERLWCDGRVDEAHQVGTILRIPDNYGNQVRRRDLYRAFADFGRAPLRLSARAGGWQATADRYVEVYRRYPRSRIAPLALLRASRMLEYPPESAPKSREIRKLIVSRYPGSPAAMLCRAETAAEEGRFDEATKLGAELERRRLAKGGDEYAAYSDEVGGFLVNRIASLRTLRTILEPVLKAAGRADLLRAVAQQCYVSRPWEQLAAQAPEIAADIRLAFARHPQYGSAAQYFLRNHPDHPEASGVWAMMQGGSVYVPQGASLTDAIRWLVDLVNREPAYAHRAAAERLLDGTLSAEWPASVGARCRSVRETWPHTRAHMLAGIIEARSLIIADRPEEARDVLDALSGEAALDGDIRVRWGALRLCAEQTIAAKRRPLWEPERTYRGPKPKVPDQTPTPWQLPPGCDGDLAALLLQMGTQGSPRATYQGVVYVYAGHGILKAVDLRTGARLGVAWTGLAYPRALTAGADGVRLSDDYGMTVVLPPLEGSTD